MSFLWIAILLFIVFIVVGLWLTAPAALQWIDRRREEKRLESFYRTAHDIEQWI